MTVTRHLDLPHELVTSATDW